MNTPAIKEAIIKHAIFRYVVSTSGSRRVVIKVARLAQANIYLQINSISFRNAFPLGNIRKILVENIIVSITMMMRTISPFKSELMKAMRYFLCSKFTFTAVIIVRSIVTIHASGRGIVRLRPTNVIDYRREIYY